MALGIGRGSIAHRRDRGKLHLLFPSVFSVGYLRRDQPARRLAALLYAGNDALLSHQSAAALWGIASDPADVHLTQIGRYIRPHPGLCLHRVTAIDIRDVRLYEGLPVTSPARTLVDFAGVAGLDQARTALAQARVRRLVTDRDLGGAIERASMRTGASLLRRLLRRDSDTAPTRSEAERRLLGLVADARLPKPQSNVHVCGFEVDFLWRADRLIVEIDGYAFHAHRTAFERDRERDQVLVAAGYRVIRVTWRQLCEEPLAVAVRIARALDAPGK